MALGLMSNHGKATDAAGRCRRSPSRCLDFPAEIIAGGKRRRHGGAENPAGRGWDAPKHAAPRRSREPGQSRRGKPIQCPQNGRQLGPEPFIGGSGGR